MVNFKKEKASVSIINTNMLVIRGEENNKNIGYTLRINDLDKLNEKIELFENMTLKDVRNYLIDNNIKFDEVEFV